MKHVLLALAAVALSPPARAESLPPIRTVFVILMENKSWSDIHDNPAAPFLNRRLLPLAAHAEAYFAPTGNHPSLPNYLWLEAGTNFGVHDDQLPAVHHQPTADHLVTLLDRAGISWKSYQEDITGNECPLSDAGTYTPRHNPMLYFDDVTDTNSKASVYCIEHVRPHTELARDLAAGTVARYNWITPNLCHDMHDCSIAQGDAWLAGEVALITNSQAYRDGGAIFILWDEASTDVDVPIGLIVLSPYARRRGYASTVPYTHSSLLKTLQLIFDVGPPLGDAVNATDLGDLFDPDLRRSWTPSPPR